jgi:hypothetical protein
MGGYKPPTALVAAGMARPHGIPTEVSAARRDVGSRVLGEVIG